MDKLTHSLLVAVALLLQIGCSSQISAPVDVDLETAVAVRPGGCPEGPPCPKKNDGKKKNKGVEQSDNRSQKQLVAQTQFSLNIPPSDRDVLLAGIVGSSRGVLLDTLEIEKRKKITYKVQRALKRVGYYKEDVDGIARPSTIDAMNRFQRDNDLKTNRFEKVNIETLKALGIDIPDSK